MLGAYLSQREPVTHESDYGVTYLYVKILRKILLYTPAINHYGKFMHYCPDRVE